MARTSHDARRPTNSSKSLDTNVLARFFIDDADDAAKQHPAAIAARSERSFVSVTVLLEFE